tara:strand:- start:2407 stop:3429 length:1023 start_codon:yes stop_codon:yes gene_type:complete
MLLNTRQKILLKLIVDDYVATASPVASEKVCRKYNQVISPATVRKEMAELEELGYLERPYASSGCVPMDLAYRFYVSSLPIDKDEELFQIQRVDIEERLLQVEADIVEWINLSSAILADLANNMALVTFPKAIDTQVKHIELVRMQAPVVMLIVVLKPAMIRRYFINLNGELDDSRLNMSANRVRNLVIDSTLDQINSKSMGLTHFEQELLDSIVIILEEEERSNYRGHYVDGLRNLINQPEFLENESLRMIVEGIEDGTLIDAILDEISMDGIVRVVIGGENRGDLLRPLSLVVSQYGIPGRTVGALGAVGPTRMQYSRTIAGVQLMSTLMTDMLELYS